MTDMSANKTVLIVDDDHNLCKTLSDILETKGFSSIPVPTGKTAFEKIEKELPAIALIDIRLADISGLELLGQIKNAFPNTECIVMTGHASQESAIEAVNLGAYGYVQKPLDIDQLLITIDRALEKQEAAKNLRKSEERFRQLSDNIQEVFWIGSPDWNEVHYISPAYEQVWKRSLDSLYHSPRSWLEAVFEEDREKVVADIEKKSASGHFKPSLPEYRIVRPDGSFRWIHARAFPVRNEQGEVYRIAGIAEDITERRKTEEEKAQLEEQLRQALKMEAIGTLAGGIAHDFNNILSAILGNAEMCQYQVPEQSSARYSIDQILQASNRARELVRQILAFSRQMEQERRPVNIGTIVKESLGLIRASLPATIEISQIITAERNTILADPTKIQQTLINLCTNALHAMGEKGGVLEVSLDNVDIDSTTSAQHPDLEPGSYVRLAVSDTGHGISPEVTRRIFDPYFTTKDKGVGTGMGLATAHGIVKEHHGAIRVESEPGKGSVFKVFLPLAEIMTEDEYESPKQLPQGTGHILFVDDEQSLADLGKRMLEHLGYQVAVRTSSIEALESFRAQPDKYDLVMTDMTMPGMTGKTLAEEILRIRPAFPVVLCTGYSEIITEEKALHMGIKGFIMKPLLMGELAETLRMVLDQ